MSPRRCPIALVALVAAGCEGSAVTGVGPEQYTQQGSGLTNVMPGHSAQLGNVPTNQCPLREGITGWWTGDGSGMDVVGGRTASLHGDASFEEGLVGDAFQLFGDGDFVSVSDDPALNVGAGDFTVALWVNFDTTEGEQILVEKWVQRYEEPSLGWTLTKLDDHRVRFEFPEGGVSSPPRRLLPSRWYHFAARRDGRVFSVLLDGHVVGTGVVDAGSLDSPSSLKFGHRGDSFDTPGSLDDSGFYLNGRIDEVELYVGRALTNAELRAAAHVLRGRRC